MREHKIKRLAMALLMGMALALPGVSAVVAAPPPGDYIQEAIVIGALPFDHEVDITGYTVQFDEPQQDCGYSPQTVWYSFTPTSDVVIRVNLASGYDDTLRIYRRSPGSGGTGFEGLDPLSCAMYGADTTLYMHAGTTYYLQAGSMWEPRSGNLRLHVEQIPPPSNDNWADAKPISSLPFDDGVDTVGATLETDEPKSSCGASLGSIWYAFAPTEAGSFSALVNEPWEVVLAVYTGDSLSTLTEIGCRAYGGWLTFSATANATYYFQVGRFGGWPWVHFRLEVTPPPVAGFGFGPYDPAVFDTVQFYDWSYDPIGAGIQTWSWNLGDGTTAVGQYLSHKYAADGDYTVSLTVTTPDGRTASASQVVHVKTHDVAIVRLGAPQSASAGHTRHVTVDIKSNRYEENVRVELLKSVPGGFQSVGMLTMFVPVRPSNRTTQFDFSYTFTADDARIGKVTFKAVATIENARDALPADNEAIASPTKVGR